MKVSITISVSLAIIIGISLFILDYKGIDIMDISLNDIIPKEPEPEEELREIDIMPCRVLRDYILDTRPGIDKGDFEPIREYTERCVP